MEKYSEYDGVICFAGEDWWYHNHGHFDMKVMECLSKDKKILFVNWTYTKKIIGLEKKVSDKILEKIFEHQARLDLTCRFRWTENAVAIWDNRSVQHYAISDFFPGRIFVCISLPSIIHFFCLANFF